MQELIRRIYKQYNCFIEFNSNGKLTKESRKNFESEVDFNWIIRNMTLSEEFLIEFKDNFHWPDVFSNKKYSEKLIKYIYTSISFNHLHEDFKKFKEKRFWETVSYHQNLSEDFIREFQDKLSWGDISSGQILSEGFIIEFQDKVDWDIISLNQKLSEDFIREFKDKVNWGCISDRQMLSKDFIREFQDKVDRTLLL